MREIIKKSYRGEYEKRAVKVYPHKFKKETVGLVKEHGNEGMSYPNCQQRC